MKLDDKLQIIDRWLTYRRRVYAVPGHFAVSDNGIYEIMTPIGDAKGIPEVFNIRLEGLCDNELQKTVDMIKHSYPDGDFHIQWPYGCSDRVHIAIRGEVPKYPMDDFVFGIMKPEDMPSYPPLPDYIEIKKVANKEDFGVWCDPVFQEFWFFDINKHYHLVEEGKITVVASSNTDAATVHRLYNEAVDNARRYRPEVNIDHITNLVPAVGAPVDHYAGAAALIAGGFYWDASAFYWLNYVRGWQTIVPAHIIGEGAPLFTTGIWEDPLAVSRAINGDWLVPNHIDDRITAFDMLEELFAELGCPYCGEIH